MKRVGILEITITRARRKMGRLRRAYANVRRMDGNKENAYPKFSWTF
jgi:hypothetical protein